MFKNNIKNKIFFLKQKKALSSVISTILLIALTITLATILFGVVQNFVKEETTGSYECFDTIDNVLINSKYTCYENNKLTLAIQVKDLNITKILMSISDGKNSKTFELTKNYREIEFLKNSTNGNLVKVPNKKSQNIYYFDYDLAGLNQPKSIKIAPFTGDRQCDISDELNTINLCS